MNIPTMEHARNLLEEAAKLNPGPWIDHSLNTAKAAKNIAGLYDGLDSEAAYVLGLLHDIGRRMGVHQMRHIIDGFYYMQELGFGDAARICLTHSFPVQDLKAATAKWDCSMEEYTFINNYISGLEYNNYDHLIQLCDYLSLPSGFSLIEKRMIDVALRYGTNNYSVQKWAQIFKIKSKFEQAIGHSIYDLLPGVVENTFETVF